MKVKPAGCLLSALSALAFGGVVLSYGALSFVAGFNDNGDPLIAAQLERIAAWLRAVL
ncbi:hypothetical protein GO986_15735 [Deinococcus sp. HMF7620]|uniref:Uncharacterized protein n=1 Tax=Deinococcus arboris TaxID=2682977 RepID=A0A7C9LSI7_9DEIO|nr:hypothetical protein [Deinococcus arboris]MVN88201.1 hypothetical protein [Deinococcus arboris]